MLGQALFAEGHGYGIGVTVVMEPDHADAFAAAVGVVMMAGRLRELVADDPNDGVLSFRSHNMVELSQ